MTRSYRVGYSEQLEQFQHNRLLVSPDTSVDADQQYSEEDMPIRAIGSFHVPAGPLRPLAEALFEAIERDRVLEIEDIEADLGMIYIRKQLVVQDGDSVRTFEFALGDEVPERLQRAFERAKDVEAGVGGFPRATLRIEYMHSPVVFVCGAEARFRFRYVNDGSEPVTFLNPRRFQESGRNHFALNVWRQYEDDAGVGHEKVSSVDLASLEHRTGERSAVPSDAEWLTVDARSTLDFEVAFRFPTMPPGEYLLDVSYGAMPPGEPEDHQIVGEYHPDLTGIRVEQP